MKHPIHILTIIALLLALTACGKNDEPELSVWDELVPFPVEGTYVGYISTDGFDENYNGDVFDIVVTDVMIEQTEENVPFRGSIIHVKKSDLMDAEKRFRQFDELRFKIEAYKSQEYDGGIKWWVYTYSYFYAKIKPES